MGLCPTYLNKILKKNKQKTEKFADYLENVFSIL